MTPLSRALSGAIITLASCSCSHSPDPEGDRIPRSVPENANYYLVSVDRDGGNLRTVHSRVSPASRGYTLTLLDCQGRQFQELGYGEGKQANIKIYDSPQWAKAVAGSSKADLLAYACKKGAP